MSLSALDEAAFTYQQISGIDAAIAWHERELVRLKASRAALEALPPAEAAAALEDACVPLRDKLAVAVEALEFYADDESWRKPRGRPSLVQDDNGDLAHDTLAKLKNDAGNGDAE